MSRPCQNVDKVAAGVVWLAGFLVNLAIVLALAVVGLAGAGLLVWLTTDWHYQHFLILILPLAFSAACGAIWEKYKRG